jgi:hypothetical protein
MKATRRRRRAPNPARPAPAADRQEPDPPTGEGFSEIRRLFQHPRLQDAVVPNMDWLPLCRQLRTRKRSGAEGNFCKGLSDACRGWATATGSVGRRPASGEETAGPDGRGGAAGYGDLTAWPLALMAARSDRFRWSGHLERRPGGFSPAWLWRSRAIGVCREGLGVALNKAVPWPAAKTACFERLAGVIVTVCRPCSVAGRAAGVRARRSR